MRKILFKGKSLSDGKWVEGYYVETLRFNCMHWIWDGQKYIAIDPETVGQYTGLTDKNGQRIFEGDIVKVEYVGGNTGLRGTETVAFHDGMFGYFWGPNRTFVPLSGFVRYTFEVIGNVHDDPELVKED